MAEHLTQTIQALNLKIQQLEEKSAYQEDTLESLNATIGKQHQDIQKLQTQIRLLSEFIKNLKSELNSGIKHASEETPPPHY